jgi:hypothetical protein
MCLEEHSSKENNIIFIDFGNMTYVDKTDIRKMIPEFVETPAVALLCSIQGWHNFVAFFFSCLFFMASIVEVAKKKQIFTNIYPSLFVLSRIH